MSDDTRISFVRGLLAEALETGDHTYMRALIVDAAKELQEIAEEF